MATLSYKIHGLEKALNKLRKHTDRLNQSKANKETRCFIGYTQDYAIYVHEIPDPPVHHPTGNWKFLEHPKKRMARILQEEIKRVYKQTQDIGLALTTAGLGLQRASQLEVPVDLGALKLSAYTALEKDREAVAAEALAKSNSHKMSAREQRLKDKG